MFAKGNMTDTERLDYLEKAFQNETVSFTFMRFAGWEATRPWLLDRHNYGYRRWNAITLRELIDGFAADDGRAPSPAQPSVVTAGQ